MCLDLAHPSQVIPEIHDMQVDPKSSRTFRIFSLILDLQWWLLTNTRAPLDIHI